MDLRIRIVRLSSQEIPDLMAPKLAEFATKQIKVFYEPLEIEALNLNEWPYTAGSAQHRAKVLLKALSERQSNVILCARGGYGMSDLLTMIPWAKLKKLKPKPVVGFSDASALHAVLYTKLGWPSWHAPMPATKLWDMAGADVQSLLSFLVETPKKGTVLLNDLKNVGKTPRLQGQSKISGVLFGGCFSVLTNLIGTPYFPKTLKNKILFFEDTGENPGRLMRFFNQWLQAGAIRGVKAIILGNFRKLVDEQTLEQQFFEKLALEFQTRSGLPVYTSQSFGHIQPNYPLPIGGKVEILGNILRINSSHSL